MNKRTLKFLLGMLSCIFVLISLAPISAQETTNESVSQTTVVEETVEVATTVTLENKEEMTQKKSTELSIEDEIFDITQRYGYDVSEYYRPESAILVDAETGQILYGDHIDKPWDPASTTKLMTAYLVYEAIKAGKITLDTKITATELDRAISTIDDISNNQIRAGIEYPVRDLLYLMMYPSSNVATVMLSHAISQSNEEYIKMMNDKAKELGMTNSKFYNPSGAVVSAFRGLYTVEGVPDEYNQTTARDLATLSYYFLKNFPEFLEITREPAVTTMEGTVVEETFYTLNQLASGMNQGYFHVDGFKTGSSPNAALNHVITAKEKGRRVIEVLMGVGSWSDYNTSVYYRAQFGNAILEKAFTEYHEETVLKAGVHEIDGQKIKVEKDIKAITKGDSKPTYKLVGDEIIVENTFPTLTKAIKSNVHKVTKVVEETTTEEPATTSEAKNEGVLSFNDEDTSTFVGWLRGLSKNPLLLAGILLALSVFISGIVIATVQVFKKDY